MEGMDMGILFLGGLFLAGAIVLLTGIRIVDAGFGGTVVTLGRPGRNVRSGIHWIIPGIQRIDTVDVRTTKLDQPAAFYLAKDNVPVRADPFWTRRVVNPRKALYNVADPDAVLAGLSRQALVRRIGEHNSTVVTSDPNVRRFLERELRASLLGYAEQFGVEVQFGGFENLRLPAELEDAQTQVRVAEQQKTASITRATAEAEVATIEQRAEGSNWIPKTQWDTLAELGRAGQPPLVIVGSSGGEQGLLVAVLAELKKLTSGLGGAQ